MREKDYIRSLAARSCENGKCLASIIDNSVIMCDEIIKETKSASKNFNEKRWLVKQKILYFTCLFINSYSIF